MTKNQWDSAVEITVTYRTDGNWHLFTSDQIDGLCVASPNLEMAFEDVPVAVRELLKLDHDVTCKVSWNLTYMGFLRELHRFATTDQQDIAKKAQAAVEQRTQALMDHGSIFLIVPQVEQRLSA